MSKLDTPEADFLRINNTLKLKNKKGGEWNHEKMYL